MKKILLLLVVILFLGCGKTLEEKSYLLIKKHINENVDDLTFYEEISTTPLDSLFTHYALQPEVHEWLNAAKRESEEADIITALANAIKPFAYFDRNSAVELKNYARKLKKHGENMKAYSDSIDVFKQSFVPTFVGLTRTHKYRSKDQDGNITIKTIDFVFNDDYSEIEPFSPRME